MEAENIRKPGSKITDDDATVTVKFSINAEEIFTKAFRKRDTVDNIKVQLARLFSVDRAHIQLSKSEQTLSDDFRLAKLGVEALGTIDLTVSINIPFVLNRDLIYGHIPTVDIINVRGEDGAQHIVEIEYQNQNKEWLGGFRHTINQKEYHHACTQTPVDQNERRKVSKCIQIDAGYEKSTSTPINQIVQTSIVPSKRDKFLTARAYSPAKDNVSRQSISCTDESPKITVPNKWGLKRPYEDINRWNRAENEKLSYLDVSERRLRRIEILDLTRKLLMRANRENMEHNRRLQSRTNDRILQQAGSLKIIVNKSGQRIAIDTVEAQQARYLKFLYDIYQREVGTKSKMEINIKLREFFSGTEYEFKKDILQLLDTELNLLAKGLVGTPNLKTRIQQFILHFFKQTSGDNRSVINRNECSLRMVDLTPYRVILTRLQDDEMKVFKCCSSICFRMPVTDMYRLVHEIWEDCSIRSSCRDLYSLRMTRWLKEDEWSPSNCLLLSKYEVKEHLKTDIANYETCFVSKVKNHHFRAQLLFCSENKFFK